MRFLSFWNSCVLNCIRIVIFTSSIFYFHFFFSPPNASYGLRNIGLKFAIHTHDVYHILCFSESVSCVWFSFGLYWFRIVLHSAVPPYPEPEGHTHTYIYRLYYYFLPRSSVCPPVLQINSSAVWCLSGSLESRRSSLSLSPSLLSLYPRHVCLPPLKTLPSPVYPFFSVLYPQFPSTLLLSIVLHSYLFILTTTPIYSHPSPSLLSPPLPSKSPSSSPPHSHIHPFPLDSPPYSPRTIYWARQRFV